MLSTYVILISWKVPIHKKNQVFYRWWYWGRYLLVASYKNDSRTFFILQIRELCAGAGAALKIFITYFFIAISFVAFGKKYSTNWAYNGAIPHSVLDLLMIDMGDLNNRKGKLLWGFIVPGEYWSIWLEKNKRIFEESIQS